MQENYAAMYRQLHRKAKAFKGGSIKSGLPFIVNLVEQTKPRRLLDYGCGKGFQYHELKVHEQWGGQLPYLYDPGVLRWSTKPSGTFDAVICTDVLEHIAKDDLPEVLAEIFSYLPPRRDDGVSFAFFWVACRPARRKTLPDGRNVHLTVEAPAWWETLLQSFARDRLIIEAHYDEEPNA